MIDQVRYLTDERGTQVGVVLDLEEYRRLTHQLPTDTELLIGLSESELKALAESLLAPAAQARLDDLLTRNAEAILSEADSNELDRLIEQVDNLTILKTRALYTLSRQAHMLALS